MATSTAILKPLVGLHIEGRRWFRRSAGNTYSSARIYANGELLKTMQTGGYGDYYLQMALDWLREQGYIEQGNQYGTLYLRETLHGTCSVIDVPRERDL